MSKSKAVAKKADQNLVPEGFDESLFKEDSGAGQEGMDKDDYAIPRISILQALSPQLQKQKSEYIEGADMGQIFDSVTHNLYDGEEGIRIVPVYYRRAYIEWALREKGGGFIADHDRDMSVLDKCKRDDKGRDITPNGTQIVTTAEYYCLLITEDGLASPVALSMSSSQMKKAKRLNSLIDAYRIRDKAGELYKPAMFYRSYRLTVVPESNDQGSWFGWDVASDEDVINLPDGYQLYLQARSFREAVTSGQMKAAPAEGAGAPAQEDDDSPM